MTTERIKVGDFFQIVNTPPSSVVTGRASIPRGHSTFVTGERTWEVGGDRSNCRVRHSSARQPSKGQIGKEE